VSQNSRPVKCPGCEQYFKRTEVEFVQQKNRYWHKKCLNKVHEKEQEKKKLVNYIERLLHKELDYKVKSQLNNFCLKKQYSYKDIYNALYYFYDIKNNSTAKANGGIGIVPYVIDEARAYFEEKSKINTNLNDIEYITKKRTIHIKNPTLKPKYYNDRVIDINEL